MYRELRKRTWTSCLWCALLFKMGLCPLAKRNRAVVVAITCSLLLRNVINRIKSTLWLIGALILSVILPLKTIVAYNIKIFKNDTLYNKYYQHVTIFCGPPKFYHLKKSGRNVFCIVTPLKLRMKTTTDYVNYLVTSFSRHFAHLSNVLQTCRA